MDRSADPVIGGAPADIAGHCRVDVFVGRFRNFGQQGCRRHDLTGLAVSALDHIQLSPGSLHGLGCGAIDALDGQTELLSKASERYVQLQLEMSNIGAQMSKITDRLNKQLQNQQAPSKTP